MDGKCEHSVLIEKPYPFYDNLLISDPCVGSENRSNKPESCLDMVCHVWDQKPALAISESCVGDYHICKMSVNCGSCGQIFKKFSGCIFADK